VRAAHSFLRDGGYYAAPIGSVNYACRASQRLWATTVAWTSDKHSIWLSVGNTPHRCLGQLSNAFALIAIGKQQETDATIAEYENKYATLDPNSVAAMYAVRGETDKAFDWLDRAYDARDADLIELKVQPHFKSLRTDRRYRAFLTKMNML
jgi:hypothetical protein